MYFSNGSVLFILIVFARDFIFLSESQELLHAVQIHERFPSQPNVAVWGNQCCPETEAFLVTA